MLAKDVVATNGWLRTGAVLVGLLLAVGSTAVLGGSSSTPAVPEACAILMVMGARGTGEADTPAEDGLGATGFAAFQQIQAHIPSARVYGLPYAASPLTALQTLSAEYRNSLTAGEKTLLVRIRREVADCPTQRLALIGYSQGADVVADTLPQLATDTNVRQHIATVTLFGDPRFNPTSSIEAGSYSRQLQGIEPALGLASARAVSTTWVASTRSYCIADDFVCNWSPANAARCPQGSGCGHYGYLRSGLAAAAGTAAATYILTLPALSPASTSSTRPATPPPATSVHTYGYAVSHTCTTAPCGLNARSGPGYSSYALTRVLADHAAVAITCQIRGEPVVSPSGQSSDIWDHLLQGDYVADLYIDTPAASGAPSPPIPRC